MSISFIRFAEYNQPDDPVPVDIITPLDLNFPSYFSSTVKLKIDVLLTRFSATKTSFNAYCLCFLGASPGN